MIFNKKKVQLSNGETYAYIEEGTGENLLLIHGNMSSGVHFMPILPQLAKKYHCYALDLRGFGDSTFNNLFFSMEHLAYDVKLFADALNLKNSNILCWSAGGGVALELAANYPHLVNKLFSIEGASHKGYPIFKKDEKGNPKLNEPYFSVAQMSTDPIQVAPLVKAFAEKNYTAIAQVWDAVIYPVNKPNSADNEIFIKETAKQVCLPYLDWALANLNMSNTNSAYNSGDNSIQNIKCLCAFTSADKDYVVPEYMVMENVTAIKNSKLIRYTNCGHSPLIDCPQQLVKDILDFFE